MLDAQVHRGPDGSGCHSNRCVVLGHRRLSIIDVSAAGAQPMSNEDGTIWVTYNGEMYNHLELRSELLSRGHRFRSRTDTEVILHGYEEWGAEGLLAKLRGMFSFGLYDPRLGLLLARDRLGIKPLYYHRASDGRVTFASEVRALLACGHVPNERDMDAVAGFLLAGSVAAPRTIVKGIASILPGHYLVCEQAGITDRKYWDLSFEPDGLEVGRAESVACVRTLLHDSVTRHLVSDVPVGVFLSGGVDSGAVVALAAKSRNGVPLTTLTVTFDEKEFNEGRETHAVAARFQTDHHEVRVTRSEFVSELPNFFAAMDQPTNDGVNTYFVSRAAQKAGLTVVLSGLGGDEVFWGYGHYRRLEGRGHWLAHCPAAARRALACSLALWGRVRGRDNWMRMEFLAGGAASREQYLLLRGFFPPRHVMDLLQIGSRDLAIAVEQQFEGLHPGGVLSGATGFNYIEFKRYLHDQLLRDTDVFSMAHSIEVRVPFLDHPLVEYAARALPATKIASGVNKPLLVAAADEPLLDKAGRAAKRGFSFPMDRWMKESASALEDMAASGAMLNSSAVRARWAEFRDGRLHWSRAWALSVLGAAAN